IHLQPPRTAESGLRVSARPAGRPIVLTSNAAGAGEHLPCAASAAIARPKPCTRRRGTMKRRQLSTAIRGALAVSVLATAIPVFAQDAAAPAAPAEGQKTTTLESIKVTARKREETLQEVPVAVTAFTADALDRLNVRDLSDLDAQVPNLTLY